ncbi:MAG: hypothetical protein AAF675_13700, partial [Pseudomonadota bacterium]
MTGRLDDGGSGTELSRGLSDLRGQTSSFTGDLAAATRQMRELDVESRRLARSLGTSLRSAFDKAVFGGEKLSGVLRTLASDIAGKALDAALRPVTAAVGTGVAGAVGSLTGGIGSLLGFEKGGAF